MVLFSWQFRTTEIKKRLLLASGFSMCYKSSLTGSEGLLLKIANVLLGSINKEPDVVLENFFRLIINSLIIHKLSNLSSPLKSVTCSSFKPR